VAYAASDVAMLVLSLSKEGDVLSAFSDQGI
jgi:hypothetical protein